MQDKEASIKALAVGYIMLIMQQQGYEIYDHSIDDSFGHINYNIHGNVYLDIILNNVERDFTFLPNQLGVDVYYSLGSDSYELHVEEIIELDYYNLTNCIEKVLLPAIEQAKKFKLMGELE